MGKVLLRTKVGTMPAMLYEYRSIRKPPRVGQLVRIRPALDEPGFWGGTRLQRTIHSLPWESCRVTEVGENIWFVERW